MDAQCRNCYHPIRRTEPRDGIEIHDGKYEYEWVHDNGPRIGGNPICDLTLVAEPGDQEVKG